MKLDLAPSRATVLPEDITGLGCLFHINILAQGCLVNAGRNLQVSIACGLIFALYLDVNLRLRVLEVEDGAIFALLTLECDEGGHRSD